MASDSRSAPPGSEIRHQAIVEWWTEVSRSGDAGCTSWEVLDSIQAQVTAALALGPPSIDRAEHLTARAIMLWSGQIEP